MGFFNDLAGTTKNIFKIGVKKIALDVSAATVLRTVTFADASINFTGGSIGDVLTKTGANAFTLAPSSGGGPATGTQVVTNNQASPADVTGFLIDKTLNNGFVGDVVVNRDMTDAGIVGVQNLGNAVDVKEIYFYGAFTKHFVVGSFAKGIKCLNLDGTIYPSIDDNFGVGFNDTVNGIVDTGTGFLCYGKFTQYKGNTRNRICFLDYYGNDDFAKYDTFGLNAGSGATGFGSEITCFGEDTSYWFFGGVTVSGSLSLNGNGSTNPIWQVDKIAASAAFAYSSVYQYGVPKFLMWNAPYGGGLFIGGVSWADSSTPENHVVDFAYGAADVCDFDAPVLCGKVASDNSNYWFGGEFDNVNATACPKLVMTNVSAPGSGTLLVKDAGYTSGFAATAGNSVRFLFPIFDAVPICFAGGKFNDFTSQNIIVVDNAGAEYTTYSAGFSTGLPIPVQCMDLYANLTNGLIYGQVYGGITIPATDTYVYTYVTSSRQSELYKIQGWYDNSTGNMSATINAQGGNNYGVTLSFDAPTGQLKYTSTYLPTNTSEIRWSLTKL